MLNQRQDLRMKPPMEGDVQRWIIDLFRKIGVHIGSTSQYRQSHVEEGIPDLICHAIPVNTFFWFEVKSYELTWQREGKPVRFSLFDRTTWMPKPLQPKQEEFRARALACNVKHFWGGMPQAEDALIALKLGIRHENGVFAYLPRPR
jgi:hypothetical protein